MNKSHVRFPCTSTIGEVKENLIERGNCVVVKDKNFKFAFEQCDFLDAFFKLQKTEVKSLSHRCILRITSKKILY